MVAALGFSYTPYSLPSQVPPTAQRRPYMAASFQVAPPEPFNFARPEQWAKWIRRFERFRVASGLSQQGEEAQVNTLIYAMGDEADDILRAFALTDEHRNEYERVKSKFEVFLGDVEGPPKKDNPWAVTLCLEGKPVTLTIDTGAEVTVISEEMWRAIDCPPLTQVMRSLTGPDSRQIH